MSSQALARQRGKAQVSAQRISDSKEKTLHKAIANFAHSSLPLRAI